MASAAPSSSGASLAGAGASSSELQVLLHPLVVINISDHSTRFRVESGRPTRVFGALFGTQEGRSLEIHTSFEVIGKLDAASGLYSLDMGFLRTKMEQYQEVFKDYEVLGWYSTAGSILPGDELIHSQLLELNENAIYLCLDTEKPASMKESPIKIFESVSSSMDAASQLRFAEIPYRLEVEESERISLDHVTRYARGAGASGGRAATTSVLPHLASVNNAVSLLHSRLRVIVNFLQAVRDGQVQADHKTMRRIASLWYRLPRGSSTNSDFLEKLAEEHNDAQLITYLASLTKSVADLSETVATFGPSLENRSRSMGGGGMSSAGPSSFGGFLPVGGGRRAHRIGMHP